MSRTVEQIEDEMRAESQMPAPDDAKLYALQDERDTLMDDDATPGASLAGDKA